MRVYVILWLWFDKQYQCFPLQIQRKHLLVTVPTFLQLFPLSCQIFRKFSFCKFITFNVQRHVSSHPFHIFIVKKFRKKLLYTFFFWGGIVCSHNQTLSNFKTRLIQITKDHSLSHRKKYHTRDVDLYVLEYFFVKRLQKDNLMKI